jgi:hypothetical protein
VLPPIPIPRGLTKSASLAKALRALAVGKKLSPSELAWIRKSVTESGAAANPTGGLLRSLLIGQRGAADVLKGRMAQGGFFGRGGLLRGELAPPVDLINAVKRLRGNQYGLSVGKHTRLGDSGRALGLGANYALTAGLGVGIPALGISQALKSDSPIEGTGRALGEGVGYLAGGPLGLLGFMGASMAGGEVGGRAGKAVEDALPEPAVAELPPPPIYVNTRGLHSGYSRPMIPPANISGLSPAINEARLRSY